MLYEFNDGVAPIHERDFFAFGQFERVALFEEDGAGVPDFLGAEVVFGMEGLVFSIRIGARA